jgi:beta-glucosidase
MTGSDVGVVVVGETPYAEGNGDVAMNGSSAQKMTLSAADGAAVDKVCGAMKCVVLLVSGRPLIVSDRIGEMSALVASWLPGSEGAGVADVLFGDKPFTGRLPQTWPKSLAQEPINVGDATYDPQYPFGWGLRTDAPAARAAAAAAALPSGGESGAAKAGLTALAGLPSWDKRDVLLRLQGIARHLDAASDDGWTADDLTVSLARDYAQQAAITPASAALTSDAEHQLLTGHVAAAVGELSQVAGFASTETTGSVGGTVPATLALTLGGPVSFGAFTPGVAHDYLAPITATVLSTAGDAALAVSDPSATAPGHLVNGAFVMAQPLQAHVAPGAFGTVGATPLTVLTYAGPVSNDPESVEFKQPIAATDPLRTGAYGKTLTFTLSTTSP